MKKEKKKRTIWATVTVTVREASEQRVNPGSNWEELFQGDGEWRQSQQKDTEPGREDAGSKKKTESCPAETCY